MCVCVGGCAYTRVHGCVYLFLVGHNRISTDGQIPVLPLPSLHPKLFSATCPWNVGPHGTFQRKSLKYLVLYHRVRHGQAQEHPPGTTSGAQLRAGPWAASSGHSREAPQTAYSPVSLGRTLPLAVYHSLPIGSDLRDPRPSAHPQSPLYIHPP